MWSSSGIVGGLNSLGVFPLNFRPEARRLLFRRPGSHEFWSWGGVFRRGALRTSSYALVAKVRLRVLGGGFMPVNKRSSLFAILARSLQL